MKRVSLSEELAPIFLLPLLSINIKCPFFVSSLVLFLFNCGIKHLFDKTFDFNYWPIASDCSGEEVDLSFASCQCFQAVKTNRAWQQKQLNSKTICIVDTILLVAAIF